jgi:hypothetical protein
MILIKEKVNKFVVYTGISDFWGPELKVELYNGHRNKPWHHEMTFGTIEQWFQFVKTVNKINAEIKRSPRCENGLPKERLEG